MCGVSRLTSSESQNSIFIGGGVNLGNHHAESSFFIWWILVQSSSIRYVTIASYLLVELDTQEP